MRSLYRKISLVLGAVMLITSFFSGAALVRAETAVQNSQIKINVTGTSYKVGDNIAVTIEALDTTELFGIQFSLKYDTAALSLNEDIETQLHGFYTVDDSNKSIDTENGVIEYALLKEHFTKSPIAQLNIITFNFKALKAANASITLSDIKATTGNNRITTNAQDVKSLTINDSGNTDTTNPVITLDQLKTEVNHSAYKLTGTVTDNDPAVSLTINSNPVTINVNKKFTYDVTLTEGKNSFHLIATDTAGNKGEARLEVTYIKPGNTPPTFPTPPGNEKEPDKASAEIDAATGGTVELENGAKVVIPAGALDADATITVRHLTDKKEIDDLMPKSLVVKIGSEIYEFTTTGNSRFKKPVTIVLPLDKKKIKAGQTPAIYYNNEDREQWIYLGGQVNEAKGEISIAVDHFTIFAVFTDEELVKLSDVKAHWASAFIDRLVGMKVIKGYEDRTFKPENNVTRAEFTAMLVNALGLKVQPNAELSFADKDSVPAWAKGHAKAAFDAGIIAGRAGAGGSAYFDADANITRAEMTVMIVKALQADGSGQALSFADAGNIPSWARSSVEVAVEKGIIKGYADNTFRPDALATRAEAATMISKLLDELGI